MRIVPITQREAKAYIAAHHRHLPPPRGWLFGCALVDESGAIRGVGCVARPCRAYQDGVTCEITRIATDGAANACSMLYGALRKAAAALGYTRIYTYTRLDEPGSSVRAAGFVLDATDVGGGEWSRPSRPREKAADPSPKNRYIWRKTPLEAK